MSFSIIASSGKNREIGKKGDLCFRLPEDLKYFRQTTSNHIVIMGSNTYRSIGKPLPKRTNVVLTREKSPEYPKEVVVFNSFDDILSEYARIEDEIFVIGGSSLYKMFMPHADRIYLTEIHASDKDADVFFPEFNKDFYEKQVVSTGKSVNDNIRYDMVIYTKKEGL